MRISLIAALGRNKVIGKNGAIPWKLPRDIARFKELTMGKPVVMGRKTHESIGRPLPGRKNVVITRNGAYRADGVVVAGSLESAIEQIKEEAEVFIIGGAEIYRSSLPFAHRLYLTVVDEDFSGDAFFPDLPMEEWMLTSYEEGEVDGANKHPHAFLVLDRIHPSQ
ncbi:MAG: dihydrofolate reductase [Patescibacteria group bacterium]